MSTDFDTIVMGAGVIGLAIARKFASTGQSVLVLEKEAIFGSGTSSRNSEVIHAGIYYPEGSLKAQFCVKGKSLLYRYCAENDIPHRNCGKLLVATDSSQLETLSSIEAKAANNGVSDLKRLSAKEAMSMEPALKTTGALLSPSTGIIDSHELMFSFTRDLQNSGADIAYNAEFESAAPTNDGFAVFAAGTEITCKQLINAAGLYAQQSAANISKLNPVTIPKQYLAKGSYFTVAGKTPFDRLIYPVPNTVSLGVHVTLDMAGQMRFGPDQEWVDQIDYEVDPSRAEVFYDAVRKYYPDLEDNSLQPAYSGVRPKTQSAGDPMHDFSIQFADQHNMKGLVNLYGMESPGLTSCLAIAEYVYSEIQ